MATQLCQKCKESHPGRLCDYDEEAECAETTGINEVAQPCTFAKVESRQNDPSRFHDQG